MIPLLQTAIDAGVQTSPFLNEEAKKYELPPQMLRMLCKELSELGFDIPDMRHGEVLSLTLEGMGVVEMTAATVH